MMSSTSEDDENFILLHFIKTNQTQATIDWSSVVEQMNINTSLTSVSIVIDK